jgi:hypothetical protein
MDGPHFLAYVEQILALTLKKGQIVFLDNVSTPQIILTQNEDAQPLRSFGEQSPLFSKVFPKKNATLISRTRDTPNLIEKCSSRIRGHRLLAV